MVLLRYSIYLGQKRKMKSKCMVTNSLDSTPPFHLSAQKKRHRFIFRGPAVAAQWSVNESAADCSPNKQKETKKGKDKKEKAAVDWLGLYCFFWQNIRIILLIVYNERSIAADVFYQKSTLPLMWKETWGSQSLHVCDTYCLLPWWVLQRWRGKRINKQIKNIIFYQRNT